MKTFVITVNGRPVFTSTDRATAATVNNVLDKSIEIAAQAITKDEKPAYVNIGWFEVESI
jgi:hypothetical protein